jgi:hypothetical protein
MHHTLARGLLLSLYQLKGERVMDMSFDFQPVYPRHDLMVELGQVEMAIENLQEQDEQERVVMKPDLESRMNSLLDALQHLAI